MSEKKQEQAMRIFEAMNGVDPELLARSEKEKKVVPFYRYARWMAACLALLLVGGTCYLTLKYAGEKKAETNFAADAVKENACKTKSNGMDEAVDEAKENYAEEAAMEPGDTHSAVEAECVASDMAENDRSGKEDYEISANFESSERAEEDGNTAGASLLFVNKRVTFKPEMEKYVSDKWMTIDFGNGESAQITNPATVLKIYAYLKQLETRPADEKEFTSYVTVTVYDHAGNQTDSFSISGEYLKQTGLPDTYEIIDQEYDYELLRRELDEVAQEEE